MQTATVRLLYCTDEPVDLDPADLRRFTRQELTAFDGRTPDQPIYLAVLGNVYDVSAGRKFYGPGNYRLSLLR